MDVLRVQLVVPDQDGNWWFWLSWWWWRWWWWPGKSKQKQWQTMCSIFRSKISILNPPSGQRDPMHTKYLMIRVIIIQSRPSILLPYPVKWHKHPKTWSYSHQNIQILVLPCNPSLQPHSLSPIWNSSEKLLVFFLNIIMMLDCPPGWITVVINHLPINQTWLFPTMDQDLKVDQNQNSSQHWITTCVHPWPYKRSELEVLCSHITFHNTFNTQSPSSVWIGQTWLLGQEWCSVRQKWSAQLHLHCPGKAQIEPCILWSYCKIIMEVEFEGQKFLVILRASKKIKIYQSHCLAWISPMSSETSSIYSCYHCIVATVDKNRYQTNHLPSKPVQNRCCQCRS